MPCYLIRAVEIDFTASNEDMLTKAIADVYGKSFVWGSVEENARRLAKDTIRTGKLTVNDFEADRVEQVKRRYAHHVVMGTASRMRWGVKTTGGNKLRLTR